MNRVFQANIFSTWGRLSLRARLAVGFGTVIAVMLLGELIALVDTGHTLHAIQSYIAHEDRIDKLAADAAVALESAQRNEKDFLLNLQRLGFDEARSRHASQLTRQLRVVRDSMTEILSIGGNPEVLREASEVRNDAARYEAGFAQALALYAQLQRLPDGVKPRLAGHAHTLEERIVALGNDHLRTLLLTMLRYKKNFVMDGQPEFAEQHRLAVADLQAALQRAPLAAATRASLSEQLAQYDTTFHEYTNLTWRIQRQNQDYLEVVKHIEPNMLELNAYSDSALATMRTAIAHSSESAMLLITASVLATVVLGLMIASFIMRNVKQAVDAGVRFAGELAAGNLSARLPQEAGRSEFAALSGALNTMADTIQQATRREQAHIESLRRANRVLQMRTLCSEALARARNKPELLQAICHHMLDAGGYRLAWCATVTATAIRSLASRTCQSKPEAQASGHNWETDPRLAGLALQAVDARQPVHGELAVHVLGERRVLHCVALPLIGRDETVGVMLLSAASEEMFDTAELGLLHELADEVGLALLSMRDARKRLAAEQALEHQANHDSLTGLANRTLFNDRLHQTILSAARHERQVAVMILTLDRYRSVKTSLGHDACNAMLRHTATVLQTSLREGDTLARLLGNEFAVIIGDLKEADDLLPIASKLLSAVQQPIVIVGTLVTTTASIGIALHRKDGIDAATLLHCADAAMDAARELGGNRLRFYAPEMNERSAHMFALEGELRRGIERGELLVHYQPRALAQDGSLAGAEALVRWQHPQRGLVPPSEFIPLAESSGLIVPLGAWVIREVCRQLRQWRDDGLPTVTIAINLSLRQFREEGLQELVELALRENGLEATAIGLEITESTVMDDIDDAVKKLDDLKSIGILLSLDDFGTGHSSLSRLRHLPIDHLKIDQSFVRTLTTEHADDAICRTIINLAHELGMTVIAEGVETAEQANWLNAEQCDEIQGYYYSKPLPAAKFGAMLEERLRVCTQAGTRPGAPYRFSATLP